MEIPDDEKIKELIELMNKNDLSEIEIEKEGLRIKLRKKEPVVAGQAYVERPPEVKVEKIEAGGAGESKPGGEGTPRVEIRSPMVGTFYQAAAPDAPPLVSVGDVVKTGQVVCIIEAMKLMNEIKSDVAGTVEKVLVQNATAVEFGQPMFLINPS